jgi:PAS domain S-box-containing protein
MPLIEILRATPIVGISLLVCMATVLWCIFLVPRLRHSHDRFLVGLVGLLSIYHGLRLLKDTGTWTGPLDTRLEEIGSFAITGLYLLAVLILEMYTTENRKNVLRLRLAEANQSTGPVMSVPTDPMSLHDLSQAVMESSPLPMYAVDRAGAVCYWNSAAERLFGYGRNEVMGRQLPALEEVETSSEHVEPARYLRAKDGTRIQANVWTAPIQRTGDSLRGTLTIVGAHAGR